MARFTTRVSEERSIDIGPSAAASIPPITVCDMIDSGMRKFAGLPAYAVEDRGTWCYHTFREYYENIERVARALLARGARAHDVVLIMGSNHPSWTTSVLGAISAGCVPAGVYATNSADTCAFIAADSAAPVLICETADMARRFLDRADGPPSLRTTVVFGDAAAARLLARERDGVLTWEAFLAEGDGAPAALVAARKAAQRPSQCCSLIYTSGTTGAPKGAMLSHDNVTWVARTVVSVFRADSRDRLVSYLPLSHVAAQMLDVYGPWVAGLCLYFARPDALRGSLRHTLALARPTIFFGVPRVYEKIQERMLGFARGKGCLLRAVSGWAKRVGLAAAEARLHGRPMPCGLWLAERLVFRTVRRALGLDRCRAMFSGAAPLSSETRAYFASLGMPVAEVYGLSECTGPETYNLPDDMVPGSAGRPAPGTELRIADPGADGCGEVCFRGRNVFLGYLGRAGPSADAVDGDGFLRTGDLGRLDSRGFLWITGRRKELLVTAGGENVAPVPIEDAILAQSRALGHAVLVGDGRPYVAAILTLRTEMDEVRGVPLPALAPDALAVARDLGSEVATAPAAQWCPRLRAHLAAAVARANLRVPSRAQRVRRWVLLPCDLSQWGGELTPTLKVRRAAVAAKYAAAVDALYKRPRARGQRPEEEHVEGFSWEELAGGEGERAAPATAADGAAAASPGAGAAPVRLAVGGLARSVARRLGAPRGYLPVRMAEKEV